MKDTRIGMFTLPRHMTHEEAIRYTASLGLGIYEIFGTATCPAPSPEEGERIRALAEEEGVAMPVVSIGADVCGPDGEAAKEGLKRWADLTKAVGGRYLHHTVHLPFSMEARADAFEPLLAEAVPRLREVWDYAEKLGVECVYEDQGVQFNGVRNFGRLLRELDRPAHVVLDMGNIAFVGEDTDAFAEVYADRVVHVHMKDYALRPASGHDTFPVPDGKALVPTLLGDGDMHVDAALRILKEAGYTGAFSLEFDAVSDDPFADTSENLRRVRAALDRTGLRF